MDNGARAQQRLLSRLDDDTLRMLEIVLARISEAARADVLEQGVVIPDELADENAYPVATTLEG
jgi:hypothetical protein